MIDDVIKELICELDAQTVALLPSKNTLVLMGDLNHSPFLRAVERKAKEFGVACVANTLNHSPRKIVCDKETAEPCRLIAWEDLDNLQTDDGMSCVAESVFRLLTRLDLVAGKDIAIVGRGHSVKGLAEALLMNDATVTVAHSKTKCLLEATAKKDVVIYATPEVDKIVSYDTHDLVIDLGKCVSRPGWFYCDYVDSIGKLTVSMLLNRFAKGG